MRFYFRIEPKVEDLSQGDLRVWRTEVPELPKEAQLMAVVTDHRAACPLDGYNTQLWIVEAPDADTLRDFAKLPGVTPLTLEEARALRKMLLPVEAIPVPEPPVLPPEVQDLFDDTEKSALATIAHQLETLRVQIKTGEALTSPM